jgi:hypothetical protein
LADRVRSLGWGEVVVIDDDLGRSSSGASRPGFERLLAVICEGRIGAVFAIEASRLARNGRDWHTITVATSQSTHRAKVDLALSGAAALPAGALVAAGTGAPTRSSSAPITCSPKDSRTATSEKPTSTKSANHAPSQTSSVGLSASAITSRLV